MVKLRYIRIIFKKKVIFFRKNVCFLKNNIYICNVIHALVMNYVAK